MPENAPVPVESGAKNPFDVPKGRWKAYSALTLIALAAAFIGVLLAIDVLAMIGFMAALFLGVGIVYSFMNEKGL
jgi:uncharacterized membrane protein